MGIIKRVVQEEIKTGAKFIEESGKAAGRRTGRDITATRVIKRLLISKKD